MNINPTNISDEEKTRIFNESMKNQKLYGDTMKIKPIKLDKEKFKGVIIKVDTEFRECKNADGTLLGIFPKSYNYTITLPDEVPEFQWIKIGNKWCKTEKELFAKD